MLGLVVGRDSRRDDHPRPPSSAAHQVSEDLIGVDITLGAKRVAATTPDKGTSAFRVALR